MCLRWLLLVHHDRGVRARGITRTHEFVNRYLAKMLRLADLDDGDVFLDMGSGTGKAAVAAGLLYPKMSVCRGVEILEGLHNEAKVR